MLERLVEQKTSLTLFFIRNQKCNASNLNEDQWLLAETLILVLKHFEVATLEMSENRASVSQIIPFIVSMEAYLAYASENAGEIKTIIEELKKDFISRFSSYKYNKSLNMSTVLDPRFKLSYAISDEEKDTIKSNIQEKYMNLNKTDITDCLLTTDNLTQSDNETNTSSESNQEPSSPLKKLKMAENIYNFYQVSKAPLDTELTKSTKVRNCKKLSTEAQIYLEKKEKITDEINFYLSLPNLHQKECPYKWWGNYKNTCIKKHSSSNNILDLSYLAKKYLGAPPSFVFCERLFSTGGNIYKSTRSRLTAEHENLAFVHANWKFLGETETKK
ncbi:zinc finger BED domain-containing protein 4-like [Hydra vulgaris]|uniref:Zinc finger BED domain-containing protein 4-like n=1 Tax=Hydra vulgaris TaxID=6087 RepID=A0ABM4CVN0_HYDVU